MLEDNNWINMVNDHFLLWLIKNSRERASYYHTRHIILSKDIHVCSKFHDKQHLYSKTLMPIW
jgi:hypothetical protein